jgi:hypothetical protein
MVVLADRVDQVVPLKKTLEARRDAAPPDDKPLEAVHTLFDFVPNEGSMNQAIRSLGLVAVAGEVTCLCSAMLVLAGAIRWREAQGRTAGVPR